MSVEGALMSMESQCYFASATKKAVLVHGHGISVSVGQLCAWPGKMADSCDMPFDQVISQLVGSEGHSRVVSGQHVHLGSQGQEGTGDIVPEGPAGDISVSHPGFQVRQLDDAAL